MTSEAPPPLDVQFWNERYRRGETGWDRGAPSPVLDAWAAAGVLPEPNERVLIPGCGRGHELVFFARRGCRVTGIDIAPEAVQAARERLSEAGLSGEVLQADVFDWQPEAPFDAVYEQTCLCALPPGRWAEYTSALHRWLRPQGRLYALFMQTHRPGGPPFHCAMEQMRELFPASQWVWLAEPGAVPHPNGFEELACRLRRR